jgi:hypothetical protein
MKRKLLSAFVILASITAVAQTPRLSLFEEFTGETCPPCAATNPGLNAILSSSTNTPLVVAIKWQVPIPSAPTTTWSLYRTNKAEIDWRYGSTANNGYGYNSQWTSTTAPTSGINAAPTGFFDGKHQWVYGAASDHPTYVTNAVIAAAQQPTSAFSVSMNRAWDATYSSVNLTITIAATANFTATGNLVFRTVMVEKKIHFPVQPGTNGEKDFEDVAIASFPSIQTGTAMASTWTVGQTQTITLNCPLPSYVRDKSQVAFVGFIQDDGTREVAQAVRSNPAPSPFANDPKAISAIIPPFDCGASFTPSAVVSNNGSNAITALTITPIVDGANLTPFTWTGNLAVGATATVTGLPITPSTSGGHSFSYSITGVSGGVDNNAVNNSASGNFYLASSYQAAPVVEPFATAAYPPVGWGIVNTNGGPSWSRNATANGPSASGTGASKYDSYSNSSTGDVDDLLLPPINLSGVGTPSLVFDVAYVQYTTQNDQLDVWVSDDCGQNWQNKYSKAGSTLATSSSTTAAFTPTAANQWRKEVVELDNMNSLSTILVKFSATSQYGNNMYIDNVNLKQTNKVGINEVSRNNVNMEVYPNPVVNQNATLKIESLNNDKILVRVVNTLGQVVIQSQSTIQVGTNTISIDTKELPAGLYNITVDGKNTSAVKKLTVSK